jgi:hypothetical protein
MIDPAEETSGEPSLRAINAAIPRKVRLDADIGATTLFFGLLLLGAGAVWFSMASYFAIRTEQRQSALNRDGHETIATITEIFHGRSSTDVHYRFRWAGVGYQGAADFKEDRRFDLHPGDQIPILVLPSDPSINHPSNWAWWSLRSDVVPHIFMLIFPAGGLVVLLSLSKARRLARSGWVTEGKVIACAPKGKRFRVDYEFSVDQALFDGANENSDECETGSKIRVIYMRSNPKRNDTYPLALFRGPDD